MVLNVDGGSHACLATMMWSLLQNDLVKVMFARGCILKQSVFILHSFHLITGLDTCVLLLSLGLTLCHNSDKKVRMENYIKSLPNTYTVSAMLKLVGAFKQL